MRLGDCEPEDATGAKRAASLEEHVAREQRADDEQVDLTEQENPGVAVKVNRFALIWFDRNGLAIADTGRGVTRINGTRIPSGKRLPLKGDDALQFGKTTLQVKVIVKKRTGVQK